MNIDGRTGLAVVSNGFFFRVCIVPNNSRYYSCPKLNLQLRKKKFFGLFSVLVEERVVIQYWMNTSTDVAMAKSVLPEFSAELWKLYKQQQKDNVEVAALLGEYPPKKL